MIEVTNLTKYYADRCAVKGLSFSVKKGPLVAQGTPEELQAKMQGGSGMRITVMGSAQTALDTLNAHEQVGDVALKRKKTVRHSCWWRWQTMPS